MKTIRLGAGAGFSGDRIEPAVDLAERGRLDVLVFECLAERTIALAQLARLRDPDGGYDPALERRMRAVLPACHRNGVRIVTNAGAANPPAAARKVAEVARALGLRGLRIAAVTGDDVLEEVRTGDYVLDEIGQPSVMLRDRMVSANAYLGARPIADALDEGADVVVTGRAGDPALFLGPMLHAFDWAMDDWTRLGRGTVAGHLLECSAQLTGGYFADPGYKDVPDLATLGFPIGEVDADGGLVLSKLPGTGGMLTPATVKEQLLYELHDPTRYYQPDVVADFSGVSVDSIGPDAVRVAGADGAPRTGWLKVSIGYRDSFIGEGQISYAGPGAVERGRLALEIVAERLRIAGVPCRETRSELIGVDAILGPRLSVGVGRPAEVRARFAARTDNLADAERVAAEVEALYLCGPAGGGGVSRSAREIIAIASCLIPEHRVRPEINMMES